MGGINWLDRDCDRQAKASDPSRDVWRNLASPPICVLDHQAYWTRSHLLLWGPDGGALYDPCTDRWTSLPNAAGPVSPRYHSALWTGTQLLVHLATESDLRNFYYRYDPANDEWAAVSTPVAFATAVWAGNQMIALDF